jgi:hypothetical protein
MAVFSVHPMSAMSIVLPLASLPPQPEVRMPKIMSKKKPRKAARNCREEAFSETQEDKKRGPEKKDVQA